jgi:pilus assembly protein Flp/PilA
VVKFFKWSVEFLKREDGPTAVEYAVMLALIVAVCISGIMAVGNNTAKTFATAAKAISATGS